MDDYLFDKIHEELPKFNERFCRGLAVEHGKFAMDEVRGVMKCASKSFPEGLVFEDLVRCTPLEEYRVHTRKRYGQHQIELAKSDVYMAKFLFTYDDGTGPRKLPPKYILLPSPGPGGSIRIRGTRYYVSPVLADVAISIEDDGLFIFLNRAKLTFKRSNHSFLEAGHVQRSGKVITSEIHNNRDKGSDGPRCDVSIIHYMFAKFGYREVMSRYCGVDVEIGGPEEITTETYPPNEWRIFSSFHAASGTAPKTGRKVRKGEFYEGPVIRLAIRKADYNEVVRDYVAAFFYVADHLPEDIVLDEIDNPDMWRLAVGRIVKNSRSEGKLANEMAKHLGSLSEYVDEVSIKTFRKAGIEVSDVWELFHYIVVNMNTMMNSRRGNMEDDSALEGISSMFNKNLLVLRYLLSDIVYSIFTTMFNLTPDKRTLTFESIDDTLNKSLKYDIIYGINKDKHGETATHQISGDNMFIKITNNIIPQAKTNGGFNPESTEYNPKLIFHPSQMVVSSLLNQPKSDATGRSSGNPQLYLDADDTTRVPKNRIEMLKRVEAMTRRD